MRLIYITASILFFIVTRGFAQDTEKVLFIGNSFTYYWNLPMVVEEMARYSDSHLEIFQSTLGGATLKQHWNGSRGLTTREILDSQHYDHIVLQDHSTYPLRQRDTSEVYFKKFIDHIQSKDSGIFLYATWMYPSLETDNYDHEYPIEAVIKDFAKDSKSPVLPVGRAFKLFRETYPNTLVFTDDDKHTNPNGTYLAACVIYGKLTGKSPIGLPHLFKTDETPGEKAVYYIIVRKDVAQKCQEIADKVLNMTKE